MITVGEIELKNKPSFKDPFPSLHESTQNDKECLLKCGSQSKKHEKSKVIKKLFKVMILATIFMTLETIGGVMADSIAIISDAAHMLSDLLSFIISIVSVWVSTFPANSRSSFGFHRAGVVGALASVMLIWTLTGILVYHAIIRIIYLDESELDGKIMLITSILGLGMNLIMIKVLHGDHSHHDNHSDHHHKHECQTHHHHHIQNYSPPKSKVFVILFKITQLKVPKMKSLQVVNIAI